MKVLNVVSSAKKTGASATLAKALCDELTNASFEVETVYLYDLNFKSCGDCETTSDIEGFCSKRDDLVPVLQKLIEADLVVWSMPIYLDYMCGTAKTFFDRFCIFVNDDFTINRISGKKFALIFTCGTNKPEAYQPFVDGIAENLNDFFKTPVVGTLLASSNMQFPSKASNVDIDKAKTLGQQIRGMFQ